MAQVKVTKGKVRWFYRVKSSNGNILTVSQKYFQKSNAIRAAKAIAKQMQIRYRGEE